MGAGEGFIGHCAIKSTGIGVEGGRGEWAKNTGVSVEGGRGSGKSRVEGRRGRGRRRALCQEKQWRRREDDQFKL